MSTSDLDTLVSGPVAAAGPSRWCFCYWWLTPGERNLSAAVTHAGKNLSNWPLQSTNCRRLSRSFLLPLIDLPPGTSPVHSTRLSLFLTTVGWSPAPFKPVEIPLPEQAQGRVPTFFGIVHDPRPCDWTALFWRYLYVFAARSQRSQPVRDPPPRWRSSPPAPRWR